MKQSALWIVVVELATIIHYFMAGILYDQAMYTSKIKSQFVLKVLKTNRSNAEFTSDYDIHSNIVRNWVNQFIANAERGSIKDHPLKDLKQENRKLEQLFCMKE